MFGRKFESNSLDAIAKYFWYLNLYLEQGNVAPFSNTDLMLQVETDLSAIRILLEAQPVPFSAEVRKYITQLAERYTQIGEILFDPSCYHQAIHLYDSILPNVDDELNNRCHLGAPILVRLMRCYSAVNSPEIVDCFVMLQELLMESLGDDSLSYIVMPHYMEALVIQARTAGNVTRFQTLTTHYAAVVEEVESLFEQHPHLENQKTKPKYLEILLEAANIYFHQGSELLNSAWREVQRQKTHTLKGQELNVSQVKAQALRTSSETYLHDAAKLLGSCIYETQNYSHPENLELIYHSAQAYYLMAKTSQKLGHSEAEEYFKEARRILVTANIAVLKEVPDLLHQIIREYGRYMMSSNLEQAVALLAELISLCEDKEFAAACRKQNTDYDYEHIEDITSFGVVLYRQKEYAKAISVLTLALEQLSNPSLEYEKLQESEAMIRNALSVCYLSLANQSGTVEDAVTNRSQALAVLKHTITYNLETAMAGLSARRNNIPPRVLIRTFYSLADSYWQLNMFSLAVRCFKVVMKFPVDFSDVPDLQRLQKLAELYIALNQAFKDDNEQQIVELQTTINSILSDAANSHD
jgi:hypothetical protein